MTRHRSISKPSNRETSALEVERLWRRKYTRFLRVAYRLTNGDTHVAEALVSRTTLRILEYVQRNDQPIDNIEAFFFASLRNSALDHWRRQSRDTEGLRGLGHLARADQAKDETLHRVMARQELGMIAKLLSEQPSEMAELVRLRIFEHQPYSRIAARLGVSEALVRKRMQVARSLLRRRLNPENLSPQRHNSARRTSSSTKHTRK